jgi:hypothetical protein
MVRGTGATGYTYLATVYTTLGIRAHPTRPGFLYGLWGALLNIAVPSADAISLSECTISIT